MKKVFLITIIFFNIILFSTNFNLGLSVLTDKNSKVALNTGIKGENFDFSFEFYPDFSVSPVKVTSITDIAAVISKINNNISIDGGVIWFNDSPNEKDRSLPFVYVGFNYKEELFFGKLYFGYPLQDNVSLDLTDYLILKVGFTVPKPQNFVDDIKIVFRFTKERKDFSIFLSTPVK